MKKELRTYCTKTGVEPFIDWIKSLKDIKGRAQINSRLNRLALGNYGDCDSVGGGVFELRIHLGPGYRIYFSEQENTIILLLLGGHKRSQKKDIKKAKEYWNDFRERNYD